MRMVCAYKEVAASVVKFSTWVLEDKRWPYMYYQLVCSSYAITAGVLRKGFLIMGKWTTILFDLFSLQWFTCGKHDILYMKLFRTGNIEVVRDCQVFFNFDLPSMLLRRRTNKFIGNYRNSGNDLCKFLCTS